MENTKHIAWRTCIATGEKKDKKDMIRLVKLPSYEVVVDLKGKEKGRGANLSMNMEAFELAIKKGAIERTLKLNKKLSFKQVDKLRKEFENAINEKQMRRGSEKITLKISKEEFGKITA